MVTVVSGHSKLHMADENVYIIIIMFILANYNLDL